MLDAAIKVHLENLLVNVDKSELLNALNNASSNEELIASCLPVFINLNANYQQILQRNQVKALNSVIEYFQIQLNGKFEENSALAKEFELLLANTTLTSDAKLIEPKTAYEDEDMYSQQLEMVETGEEEEDELENNNLIKPTFASSNDFMQRLLEQFNKLYPNQKDQTLQSPDFLEALKKYIPQINLSADKISPLTLYDAHNTCSAQTHQAANTTPKNNDLLSQLRNQKASIFVMQAIEAYWQIITTAYDSHSSTAMLYGTNGVNKIMSYCNAAQIELFNILGHPAARFYLTLASVKDAKFESDPSINTNEDNQIFDCEDPELLKTTFESLEIKLGAIYSPNDYKPTLRAARSLLMLAASIYAQIATKQDSEQGVTNAAKNQLRALLNNPYVQSIKDKIPNLSAQQAEELFKKSEPVAGKSLAFSKEFNEVLSGTVSVPGAHSAEKSLDTQVSSSSPQKLQLKRS